MLSLKSKLKKIKFMKSETQFVFATKDEIDDLDVAQYENSIGFLAFNQDEISKKAIEIMKNRRFGVNENGMTPSQVLRGKVFKLWTDHDKYQTRFPEFEKFYLSWMNHFNNEIDRLI